MKNVKCYLEGHTAYATGRRITVCPYYHDTEERESWMDGYEMARASATGYLKAIKEELKARK